MGTEGTEGKHHTMQSRQHAQETGDREAGSKGGQARAGPPAIGMATEAAAKRRHTTTKTHNNTRQETTQPPVERGGTPQSLAEVAVISDPPMMTDAAAC